MIIRLYIRKEFLNMATESLSQSVQFTFKNEDKYGKNGKNRVFANIKRNAEAEAMLSVGEALSALQGDELDTILIDKKAVRK